MIRTPDIPTGALVAHWPTEKICRVLRSVHVGYTGWRYYVTPLNAPNVVYPCMADDLVRLPFEDYPMSRVASIAAARQAPADANPPHPIGGGFPSNAL